MFDDGFDVRVADLAPGDVVLEPEGAFEVGTITIDHGRVQICGTDGRSRSLQATAVVGCLPRLPSARIRAMGMRVHPAGRSSDRVGP